MNRLEVRFCNHVVSTGLSNLVFAVVMSDADAALFLELGGNEVSLVDWLNLSAFYDMREHKK